MKNKVDPKKLIADAKQNIFESLSPVYLLDEAYYFVGWNRAFQKILAEPLSLKLKMHASEFVGQCENRKEVQERTTKVFGLGNTPIFDHEPLVFRTPAYGRIAFEKLAVTFRHKATDEITWIVSLNISECDKMQKLFDDLIRIMAGE